MRTLQPSFARGEISPDLHARVDLAFYNIALAKLVNMIVLPQGVLTRRPGFLSMGPALTAESDACPVRLIPFIYSREDAMVVELGDGTVRVWRPQTGEVTEEIASPYAGADIKDVRYVQSGNVLFLTHRDYPVKLLRRNSLTSWEFSDFEFRKGPWLDDSGGEDIDMKILAVLSNGQYRVQSSEAYFTQDMEGRLLRLRYTVEGSFIEGTLPVNTDWNESEAMEVGDQWHFQTFNAWHGTVQLQKSLDSGTNWITVREYSRANANEEGNLDFSGAESEENVLYRVRGQCTGGTIRYRLEALGYAKTNIYRIREIVTETLADCEWQPDKFEAGTPIMDRVTVDWSLGAWGGSDGYPACSAFYQERYVLAGSRKQPQTIWFSRIGDYSNFGVSDPLIDSDAVNITIAGDDMDGIHTLAAMTDILALTPTGEWKISGYGENGALTPSAITAHRQSNTGSAPIQPVIVGGQVVMAQTMRTDIETLQYLFEYDGYRGNNISILSRHLFEWKTSADSPPPARRAERIAYQQIPDSLIWIALEDGTAVTCTFEPEHEMAAWARQETDGFIGDICCVPAEKHSELWAAVRREGVWGIERLAPRAPEEVFTDAGQYSYESLIETLRINLDGQGNSLMAARKHIPHVTLYTLRSGEARAAPKSDRERAHDRKIALGYGPEVHEERVTLDSGFESGAGIQIRTDGAEPLTVLAISPSVTAGG